MIQILDLYTHVQVPTQAQLTEYDYLVELFKLVEPELDKLLSAEVYGYKDLSNNATGMLFEYIMIDKLISFEEFLYANNVIQFENGWKDEPTKLDMINFFNFKEYQLHVADILQILNIYSLSSF